MAKQKTGAAKHSADYRERQRLEAERLGIEEVVIKMPSGIKKLLVAEVKAHGYDQVQALWQDMALSWVAADPEERARRLQRPDAPAFRVSPKLARQFDAESIAELKRNPGDEVLEPPNQTKRH